MRCKSPCPVSLRNFKEVFYVGYLTKLSGKTCPIQTAPEPKPASTEPVSEVQPIPAPQETIPVAPAPVSQEPSKVEPMAAAEVSQLDTTPKEEAEQEATQLDDTPVEPIQLDGPAAPNDTTLDDTTAKKAHEAAEAKRKAEFDAKQAAKKAARQEQLDRIKAMTDADLMAASMERVAADTEKLTRRNMKEAVSEHIQAKCRENAAFALLVMDPDKSMINCFQYINRKAREYAEQEMKDNGIERTGVYGCDVPDGLCFQWAEDYFNDKNAKEDKEDDEKFVPKPYVSTARKTAKAPAAKKKSDKKSEQQKPAEKPKPPALEQMSLL